MTFTHRRLDVTFTKANGNFQESGTNTVKFPRRARPWHDKDDADRRTASRRGTTHLSKTPATANEFRDLVRARNTQLSKMGLTGMAGIRRRVSRKNLKNTMI